MSSACTPVLSGRDLLWFRRYGYLSKTAKFPFRGMDYSPWSSKNLMDQNWLKKFMQIGIDVTCMHTNFGGHGLVRFRRYGYLSKLAKFPFRGPWTIVHGHWKILIDRNRLKKFMHVGVNVTCMHTSFGGRDPFWFRRYGYLSKTAKFPFWGMDIEKFSPSESAQKIYASRDRCQVHAHQFWWVWPLRFQR